MERKKLFIAGIFAAYGSLAMNFVVAWLAPFTYRDLFVFWDFIGGAVELSLIISSLWVAVVALVRWKHIPASWRFAALSPTLTTTGIAVFMTFAPPMVTVNVVYEGQQEEVMLDITTDFGERGNMDLKRGEPFTSSEGRGEPRDIHVRWGSDYTNKAIARLNLKDEIPLFGRNRTVEIVLADSNATATVALTK